MSVALLNCRSINNKTMKIKDFIVDNDFDLFLINESHIVPDQVFIDNFDNDIYPTDTCKDRHIIKTLLPAGYKITHLPRIFAGGGNAMIYKKGLNLKTQKVCTKNRSFEYMEVLVKSCGKWH